MEKIMILNPRKYKEFNKLFAEYIGCVKDEEGNFQFPDGSKMTKIMHFHDKWDWLMMVVEKIIGNYCYLTIDGAAQITSAFDSDFRFTSEEEKTLILNIYNVCYQYIKYINNEN